MLCQAIIPFTSKRNLKYGYLTSSLMHGILMETISPDYANQMHTQSLRPFSQFSCYENDQNFWMISCFGKEAYDNIISPVLSLDSATVRQKNDLICFGKPECHIRTYDQIIQDNIISEGKSDRIRMNIITPTAFKKAGAYQILPTPRLVCLSIARHFDLFSGTENNDYEAFAEEVEKHILISEYNLSSKSFSLEGIRIPSFSGHIVFRVTGDNSFRSYISMLFDFARYSGIGIKTALGMGQVTSYKL